MTNGVPAVGAVAVGSADPYAAARFRVAQLVASRMKGVDAVQLDAVWARTDVRRMTAVFAALSQVGRCTATRATSPAASTARPHSIVVMPRPA